MLKLLYTILVMFLTAYAETLSGRWGLLCPASAAGVWVLSRAFGATWGAVGVLLGAWWLDCWFGTDFLWRGAGLVLVWLLECFYPEREGEAWSDAVVPGILAGLAALAPVFIGAWGSGPDSWVQLGVLLCRVVVGIGLNVGILLVLISWGDRLCRAVHLPEYLRKRNYEQG